MKDTLKMQETHPVVGIKKIIDYYNENYTKKKECICKDLRPTRMLDVDEYRDFVNDGNEATPLLEKPYFPLFKTPKIINNISKKFLIFAELKAVDVTIVKFLKSCINISLKCMSKTKMSLEENLRLFLARIQFLHSLSYFPSHYSITSSHTFDFNFIYLI